MKTKIKRHSHSVVSIVLSLCMLVSCLSVGIVATDAARVSVSSTTDGKDAPVSASVESLKVVTGDEIALANEEVGETDKGAADDELVGASADSDETVGASSYYLLYGGQSNPTSWTNYVSATKSGTTYTANIPSTSLTANTNYYVAMSGTTSYKNDFNQVTNGSGNTIAGVDKSGDGFSGSLNSENYNITNNSTNVTTTYYCVRFKLSTVNSGNYKITYDTSTRKYKITAPAGATYTITTQVSTGSGEGNGTLTSNKSTAAKDDSVTLTVTPERGYKLKSLLVDGTEQKSQVAADGTYTFTMPAKNITAVASFEAVTSYSVTAAVSAPKGSVKLTLKLGTTIVATATATDTSSASLTAYEGESLEVTTTPASGYALQANGLTITMGGAGTGGTTSFAVTGDVVVDAKFEKSSALSNEYTATAGSTITSPASGKPEMYYKIKATFFDYFTDHEVNGTWYDSIDAGEDGWVYNDHNEDWGIMKRNPYTALNKALSAYARSKHNVSGQKVVHPLYFGAFYEDVYFDPGYYYSSKLVKGDLINDSNSLYKYGNSADASNKSNNCALPGLSGLQLTDSGSLSPTGMIHYYNSTPDTRNGAEMVLFDKTWLNSRTTGPNTSTANKIFFDPGIWDADGAEFWCASKDNRDWFEINKAVQDPNTGAYWFTISPYARHARFMRVRPNETLDTNDVNQGKSSQKIYDVVDKDYDYSQGDYTGKMLRITGWDSATRIDYNGEKTQYETDNALAAVVNAPFPVRKTTKHGATYYEFDSGDSNKDVVYFDNLGSKTDMVMQYASNEKTQRSGYKEGGIGFYPFDRWDKEKVSGAAWSKQYGIDQAFGMKLEIKFTLGMDGQIYKENSTTDKVDQVFDFSGDDDLWVYVDGKLALDLGGDHKKSTGSINFHSKAVTVSPVPDTRLSSSRNGNIDIDNQNPRTVHTMTIYYMERGMHESNLKFGFNFNPMDNVFEVEKHLDTTGVNPGLGLIDDEYTFTALGYDKNGGLTKGKNAAYDLYQYNSETDNYDHIETDTTHTSTEYGKFTIKGGQYAYFKDKFIVGKKLSVTEATAGYYKYDTSYSVVDKENSDAFVKKGSGTNTGNFVFQTTKEGSDPDLDMTHLRAIFTNKMRFSSFMVTKDIDGYDDDTTVFPVKIEISVANVAQSHWEDLDCHALQYTSNLDSSTHTCKTDPRDVKAGIALIREGEILTFAGIPEGAVVDVSEPVGYFSNETLLESAAAMCYKFKNITSDNAAATLKTSNVLSFNLNTVSTVTITNEPKNYRADFQYKTRLYEDRIYKDIGILTGDMFRSGYVVKDGDDIKLTQSLMQALAPHESNFMENLVWTFSNSQFDKTKEGFDKYAYLLATQSDKTLTVIVDRGDGSPITISGLAYGSSVKYNDEYIDHLSNNDDFSYWKIERLDDAGTGSSHQLVVKSYSNKFNYVAYDNYYVTAVYGEGKNSELYLQTLSECIVDNLGITRNHWNDTVTGEDVTGKYNKANTEYDRLYLDLSLAYNWNGRLIREADSSEIAVGYDIVYWKSAGEETGEWLPYHDEPIANTELDNKNRLHVYYGFNNSVNNRLQRLGIRPYIKLNGGDKDYMGMAVTEFSLFGVGSLQ